MAQPFSDLLSLAFCPLEFARPVPTLGPLHLPFALPGTLFPQVWLLPTMKVSIQTPPPQMTPPLSLFSL